MDEDKQARKKQRHTARKVFQRLVGKYTEFDCSYRLVADYVSEKKRKLYSGENHFYLPLKHIAGEAQVEEARDLLDILEDRNQTRSTLITSQMPVNHWHEVLADPTLADAILDRLVHNAYKLELKGESMRKLMNKLD